MKAISSLARKGLIGSLLVALAGLVAYVAFYSGPLAPVAVTVAVVESRPIAPALYGVGTVDARLTHRIGPTAAGRLMRLDVQVGDTVRAGHVLGEMDPVDLDQRLRSLQAATNRAEAQLREAEARHRHAAAQARRYEQLFDVRSVSEEAAATKRQELQVAEAAWAAAAEELSRVRADGEALRAQRANLRLVAPAGGLVAARDVDPGTTVVAGQAVVEVIDPKGLWIDVRFDQRSAAGLAAGLPATVVLRSRPGDPLTGRVLRTEPRADAVTEEIMAKVVFDAPPVPLPPLGELAEVTVALPALPPAPAVPNAALQRVDGQLGAWKLDGRDLRFVPLTLGAADLDGTVQVRAGLRAGDQVVVHSAKVLSARTRISIVDSLHGAAR